VRGYLRGGEVHEYSAHLIPEGGYHAVGGLSANGLLIAGDAAGLVNASLYHEGSNLAMASGKVAAEVLIESKKQGNFSGTSLGQYEQRLRKSFVFEDLRSYRDLPKIHKRLPDLLSLYPTKICNLLIDFYRNSQDSKKTIQKEAMKRFFEGVPKIKMVRDAIRARKII
jgi:electron transfer flavoprotein-quinone oxidoreductase